MARVNYTGFDTGDTIEAMASSNCVFDTTNRLNSSGYSLKLQPASGGQAYYSLTVIGADGTQANATTLDSYMKFHVYVTSRPSTTTEIASFWTSGSSSPQCVLVMTSTGHLAVLDTSSTPVISAVGPVALNTWTRIEMHYSNDGDTNGAVELKLDGTSQGTASGMNGTAGVDEWVIGRRYSSTATAYTIYFEDFVVDDAAYPGDTRIVLLTPNANGSNTGWIASAGSAFQCVDDVPNNGDTDYIQSSGTESSFAMSNTTGTAIAGTSSVKAVKAIAARKCTVGSAIE
jgi:hypothetical protein